MQLLKCNGKLICSAPCPLYFKVDPTSYIPLLFSFPPPYNLHCTFNTCKVCFHPVTKEFASWISCFAVSKLSKIVQFCSDRVKQFCIGSNFRHVAQSLFTVHVNGILYVLLKIVFRKDVMMWKVCQNWKIQENNKNLCILWQFIKLQVVMHII